MSHESTSAVRKHAATGTRLGVTHGHPETPGLPLDIIRLVLRLDGFEACIHWVDGGDGVAAVFGEGEGSSGQQL